MESLVLIKKRLREAGHKIGDLDEAQIRELDRTSQLPDPFAPVVDENAFEKYKEEFQRSVDENGLEATYRSWTAPVACGCMGPRFGDPYCRCQMQSMTAEMFAKIVSR